MRTYTNMAWPDDPYRTGQQLHRRPSPRLAAFTASRVAPAAVAIVYLPLHRTRALTVTEQTLTFGFRAACADDVTEAPAVAVIAGLDLMQARRHAGILAGYLLARDLAALRLDGDTSAPRGLAAAGHDWAERGSVAGRAEMFDCGLDLPGGPSLEHAGQQASIDISAVGACRSDGRAAAQEVVVGAVGRALLIALICARHLGRYEWSGTLNAGRVMTEATWDCLPWPPEPGADDSLLRTDGRSSAGPATAPRARA